jgi:hypothetical protein
VQLSDDADGSVSADAVRAVREGKLDRLAAPGTVAFGDPITLTAPDLSPLSGFEENGTEQGGKCLAGCEFQPPNHFPTDKEQAARVRGCESNAVFHFFGCVPSRGSLGSFMSSEITS